MNKLIKASLLAMIAVLFVTGFFVFENKSVEAASDAIAVRVLANPNHLSPLAWYQGQKFTGSPSSIVVDGYQGVKDGRTVYVNVGNVVNNTFYTNIYLISYNQDAGANTVSIFNKILSNWKFNTNLTIQGNCFGGADDEKTCSTDQDCPANFTCNRGSCQQYCLSDQDCSEGLCGSLKARVIRDTLRLANINDLKLAIKSYATKNGHFPLLSSGTYQPGNTISVWPSWKSEFASELGASVPTDPINKFMYGCGNYNGDTNYDPTTCWDASAKSFAGDISNDVFPAGSYIYAYSTDKLGQSYNVCAVMESGLITPDKGACTVLGSNALNHAPKIDCGNLVGVAGQDFTGYISATDADNDPLKFTFDTSHLPAGISIFDTADPNKKMVTSLTADQVGKKSYAEKNAELTAASDVVACCQGASPLPSSLADAQTAEAKCSAAASAIAAVSDPIISSNLSSGLNAANCRPAIEDVFNKLTNENNATLAVNASCAINVASINSSNASQYQAVCTSANLAMNQLSTSDSLFSSLNAQLLPCCAAVQKQISSLNQSNINQEYFNSPNDLYVSNNYAYIVNWLGNYPLEIVDVSNPANPVHVGRLDNTALGSQAIINSCAVYVVGNYAYIASIGNASLVIVDISNKASPKVVGSIGGLTGAAGVSVVGNYAFVADWQANNMAVVDVSIKSNPVFVTSIALDQPYSIYTAGGFAYLPGRNGGYNIVDISTPTNPQLVGKLTDNQDISQPLNSVVNGNNAFLVDWGNGTLAVANVSIKASPSFVKSFAAPSGARPHNIALDGNFIYLPLYGNGCLQIIDVSDLSNIHQKGIICKGGGGGSGAKLDTAMVVRVNSGYAYVASQADNALEIINVSNPSTPTHTSTFTNFGAVVLAPSSPKADFKIADAGKDDYPVEIATALSSGGQYPLPVTVSDGKTSTVANCQVSISSSAFFVYPVADMKVDVGKTLNFSVYAYNSLKDYSNVSFYFNDPTNSSAFSCNKISITADGRAECDVKLDTTLISPQTFAVTVTAKAGGVTSSGQNFNVVVYNNPPVMQPINCPKSVRVGQPYSCQLKATDPEGQQIRYLYSGDLPPELNNNNTIIGSSMISGPFYTPRTTPYSITVTPYDVPYYLAGNPVTSTLAVNNYCGDGQIQSPNYELKGGHANDGYEDCDCGAYLNKDGSIDYAACVRASGCTGVSDPQTNPLCAQGYKFPGNSVLGGVPTTTRSTFLWQYGCTANCASANGGFCGDGIAQDGLLASLGGQQTANGMTIKHSAINYGEQCDFGGITTNCCNAKTCQWLTPAASSTTVYNSSVGPLDNGGSGSLTLPATVLNTRGVLGGQFTAQSYNADGTDAAKQAVVLVTDASTLGYFASDIQPLITAVQSGLKGFYNVGYTNNTNILVGSVSFGACPATTKDLVPNQEKNAAPVCDIYDLVSFQGVAGEANWGAEKTFVGGYQNYGDYYGDYRGDAGGSGADQAINKATQMLEGCKIYPHDNAADTAKDNANKSNPCYGASQLYMIVLSDGVDYTAAQQLTKTAKADGIKIYTIYFEYSSTFAPTMCNWSSDTANDDAAGATPLAGHICNFVLNPNNNPPAPADNFSFKNTDKDNPGGETSVIYSQISAAIAANLPKGVSVTIGGIAGNTVPGRGVELDNIDIAGGVNTFSLPADSISCDQSGFTSCSTAHNNPLHPNALNFYASFAGGGNIVLSNFKFDVIPPCAAQ